MSNPTELPDVDALLADHSGAVINYAEHGDIGSYYNDLVGAENAIRELVARRAQPEGEAPQAVEQYRLTITGSPWYDMSKTVEETLTKPRQGYEFRTLYTAPAATLSPLCGAQHAESSKVADAAEKAAAYDELNRIAELHGFASAAAAIAAARRATQQAAAPADCSGTPSSCPDNEGYGCHCSAPGTPEAPKPPFPISDDEMSALRRFWECATDGEGYDVEKAMMQRLAEMGLVQRKSGAYYMATEFGMYVLGEYTVERAAQLDGSQEGSDHA